MSVELNKVCVCAGCTATPFSQQHSLIHNEWPHLHDHIPTTFIHDEWPHFTTFITDLSWRLYIMNGSVMNGSVTNVVCSVPSPQGGFGGLSCPNKGLSPPNWNVKHYKSVEVLSIFRMTSPHPQNRKGSLYWKLSGDGCGTVSSGLLRPVVCLRWGERGTCLGPPFLGPPVDVLCA